jgi:restriction system protein
LRHRLDNLTERALLTREGNQYAITSAGLSWLKGFDGAAQSKTTAPSKRAVVIEAARDHNDEQLRAFKARLMQLSAEQFERFVKELLDAMEYEDVRVTKLSGDKGVGGSSDRGQTTGQSRYISSSSCSFRLLSN